MNIACRSSQNAMRISPETLLKITVYSMGPSSRPLFLFNVYFSSHKWIWMKSNIVSKGSLIPCLSSCRVSSLQVLYCVSTSRWRAGRWIGFPESVFVYGYSNYKFIFYPYRGPKWANSWHKERGVIKLFVKYKLLLACFILWPKFTPQYFLSTFAYLPILGHPARRRH